MNSLKRLAALFCSSVLVAACSGHHSVPMPESTSTATAGPTTSPGASSSPTATATPGPTGPFNQTAFNCPTTDGTSSVARTGDTHGGRGRFTPFRRTSEPAPNLLAITYDAATFARNAAQSALREQRAGATLVREYDFAHTGLITRVVSAQSGSLAALGGALRALPGVRSVGPTGFHRHPDTVNGPFLTDDPFFQGFGASAPLYETSTTEGQWDMHAVELEYAFAYSEAGNGSKIANADALGSTNIKLATIDYGVDTLHPDLAAKIGYQRCYISNPDGKQSTSKFVTDPDGHGTLVAGLAAAGTDNGFGFAGAGGNASIWAYRVFPTPDDSCLGDNPDLQCGVDSQDIASAIDDAVAQKVNVINLSLGDGQCSTAGVDDDSLEGNAVAEAIAANIVVVAAAGDDGTTDGGALEAPACDAGVIAVGATSISDGTTNGSANTIGSAKNPREYVSTYSDYGSPGELVNNASAWGIVAPGGDPANVNDLDNLHFVENVWTSTPVTTNYQATTCETDDLSSDEAPDCHAFTFGTSVSAPIVAGAAALVLAVNGAYQSSAKMKSLLCTTADNIAAKNQGCGRLNIYRAMAQALHDQNLPVPRPTP